jgi:membrane-bound lytic murein transglycosylase D
MIFTGSTLAQEERFQKLGVKLDPWAESQVLFWRKVYTEVSSQEYLIHDGVNLSHHYRIESSEASARKARLEISHELKKISDLGPKPISAERLSEEQRKLFEALDAIEDPKAYLYASNPDRIRIQSGLKDQLEFAFQSSKPYLKRMREMIEEEGVPKELTLLPFVESAFNQEARSSTGAVGVWQFMPKTAAKELKVTRSIDERHDPLKSTRAAARFLRKNYDQFGNWGLAIMAYHHGPGLLKKAIQKVGSRDPVTIIKTFKDPNFKFASRNYLFEFLAMCDVDSAQGTILAPGQENALPPFITVTFQKRVTMKDLAQRYRFNESLTRILNPHFRNPIWKNEDSIPAHYPVRMAGITLEEFRRVEYP